MKKLLLLLFAVLALNAGAVEVTYDYTDSEAMSALGFTEEQLTTLSIFTTVVSDQYANMDYCHFAFFQSSLYLATATESLNTSGEAGYVYWQVRNNYVVKKVVVQVNTYATDRITVLSGNTVLTPTISGTTMTYSLDRGVSTFTIKVNESVSSPSPAVINRVKVTYEQDAGIAIDATHFPDTNFRNYVLQRVDNNGDGILSTAEADAMTDMMVSYKQISSLKGIEYFTKLEDLTCSNNNLTSLDVSHNTELISLACASNQIAQLDVTMLSQLEGLNVGRNQLAQLDVSQNPKLNLVSASSNQLRELNVSNNPLLEILFVDGNVLTSLDVTNNPKLNNLRCNNNRLQSLTVVNNPALKYLLCNENSLTHLDLTYNTLLTRLNVSGNNISADAMTRLVASLPAVSGTGEFFAYTEYGNEGNEFVVSNALELMKKNWTKINYYDASNSSKPYAVQITEDRFPDANFRQRILDNYDTDGDGWLQVSEMAVTEFYCENRGVISTQGLECFPLIETLGVGANQITTLNVSGNPRLTAIWCYLNQLRGNGVSELVASLPTLPSGSGNIYAIWNPNHTSPYTVTTEGNDFGKPQVDAANAKGWVVRAEADNYAWAPYAGSDYIIFESSYTENYCTAHFDTNHDGKLSYAEAAAVTPSQLNFQNDASGALEQFDEFQFFTGLTYLPENCFKGVQGLKTITLPKGLKAVSKNAFRTCTYLERVTLPEGIKSIRDYAFFTNSVLTTINFPASLDSIGAYAFAGDKKLANIEFGGNSVKYIGTYAFSSCKELTSFNFEKVQRINRGAFETAGLTDVVLGENLCHLGQNAFATSHAMTVTLLSSNFEEIDAENNDDPYDYGLHMPITNTNLNLGTQVRIPRQIFHNAYNALTEGRELLHPYIFLDKYSKIDAVPFSCEVPVVLPQGSKIFIVTGLNHTEGEQVAYSRSMTGNVVPANTGVVVHLPDRELYTDQYWYLTANPSATAIGNYSQNILKASVGLTDLGSPEDVVRFSWEGEYNNGKFYYGWMSNPDVYGVDGCSAYLEAPLSDFPSNFAYGSGYPMDLSITGDVNGDEAVDVSDVNAVINIMLGKAPMSDFPGNPDLNNDEGVDVSDVNKIINIMLGKE